MKYSVANVEKIIVSLLVEQLFPDYDRTEERTAHDTRG
jgi:hypothetical protein